MKDDEKIETQIASLQAAVSRLTGYCMVLEMTCVLLLKSSPARDTLAEILSHPDVLPTAQDNPDAERTQFAAQVLHRLRTQIARTG